MYALKDNGIIHEVQSGNNFGYVLENGSYFVSTYYKVLTSQRNDIFVPCMKMLRNGNIELYYIIDDLVPMSAMFEGITPDKLIDIVINLFGSIVDVKNNGFLQSQNIDISWDKIFIDPATLKVRLVYLPIDFKIFSSYVEFESELRSGLVKLINKILTSSNDRLDKFVPKLMNGTKSIEDIYKEEKRPTIGTEGNSLKLVATNAPIPFEAVLDNPQTVLGRKKEFADVVIPYNIAIGRNHCTVINNNGNYYIIDNTSLNGTYVNDRKIQPNESVPIKKGDTIRLADSDFKLE